MTGRRIGFIALVTLGLTDVAAGQQPAVDVSKLPLNLERIGRQLRQASVREERDGLNLRYTVNVYGQAPHIELFTKRDNLRNGPVPHAAPTHNEWMQLMTPKEFRAPAADIGSLLNWLQKKD